MSFLDNVLSLLTNQCHYPKDCIVHSATKTFGAIAAHHRDSPYDDTGFSFINCTINGSGKVLLGRAWGNYSRIIYSYCDIDDIISPPGWSDWGFPSRDMYGSFCIHFQFNLLSNDCVIFSCSCPFVGLLFLGNTSAGEKEQIESTGRHGPNL